MEIVSILNKQIADLLVKELGNPEYLATSEQSFSQQQLELLFATCSELVLAGNWHSFQQISALVLKWLGAAACSIWEINAGVTREPIRLSYATTLLPKRLECLPNHDFEVAALTLRTGEPVIALNLSKDPRFASFPEGEALNVVAFPLHSGSRLLGTFCCWGLVEQEEQVLTTAKISVLAILAKIIALGLEKYCQTAAAGNPQVTTDLQLTRAILHSVPAFELTKLAEGSLEARSLLANQLGVDYLDSIQIQGKTGLAIGEVLGKGFQPALAMLMTKTAFRTLARGGLAPHLVLSEINQVLQPDFEKQGSTVSLLYAIYDPLTKQLAYANAGNKPPLVFRASSNEFFQLKFKGINIGEKSGTLYETNSVQLLSGDIVLFYSAGLEEALNSQQEKYGLPKIMDTLRKYANYDPTGMLDCFSYAVADFIGTTPQIKDISLAILKV